MDAELTFTSLQALKLACVVGVPSFFLGWFAHCLWDWLMTPSSPSRKERL